jgi:hypothetical protein
MRRAFARMSMTVTRGLSSMKIGASPSLPIAVEIFRQSVSCNWPVRIREAFTPASEQSIRCVSSRWLISREKRSTGTFALVAAWAMMPSAKLVFPIDGLAPTTTRFDFWRPARWASRSSNPVGTPVTEPGDS